MLRKEVRGNGKQRIAHHQSELGRRRGEAMGIRHHGRTSHALRFRNGVFFKADRRYRARRKGKIGRIRRGGLLRRRRYAQRNDPRPLSRGDKPHARIYPDGNDKRLCTQPAYSEQYDPGGGNDRAGKGIRL